MQVRVTLHPATETSQGSVPDSAEQVLDNLFDLSTPRLAPLAQNEPQGCKDQVARIEKSIWSKRKGGVLQDKKKQPKLTKISARTSAAR